MREYLGSDAYLHLRLGSQQFVARMGSRTEARQGDRTSSPSCRPRSARTACTRSRWRRPTPCSPNDGVLKRATFITKIVDRNGKTIYQAPTIGVQVLDPNVARTETNMLKQRAAAAVPRARRSAASPARPRARPARPTTTRTPGSSATRRSSPPRSGWGTPSGEIPMTNVGGITRVRRDVSGADLAPVHERRDRPAARHSTSRRRSSHPSARPALHQRARPPITYRSVTPSPDVDRPEPTRPSTSVPTRHDRDAGHHARDDSRRRRTPPTTKPKGP